MIDNTLQQKDVNLSQEEKRALLRKLLQEKARNSQATHPLSYNQRAIWFLQNLAPESPAYNVAIAIRIYSDLDAPVLKKALQTLVDRHPCLRSTFSVASGEPMQVVSGFREVAFEKTDASRWSDDDLRNRVTASYKEPFDLERGPLVRGRLFSRSASEHVLLVTMHHIVVDGWSVWLLLDELRKLYESGRSGTSATLPPAQKQYKDYVQWQSEMIAGTAGQEHQAYWREQLSGAQASIDLPADRARPSLQSYNGATYDFKLDKNVVQQLQQLAKAEGTTLFALLLAAFQIQLHRYSGQNDIVVGSPMFGRNRPEFTGIVGCFMNPVLLRTTFETDPSFRGLLSAVRQTVLGAFEHQDYPLHVIAEELWPNRDASRSTVYQAEFILQKSQQSGELANLFVADESKSMVNFGGLEVELFPLPHEEGQVDLTLEAIDANESLFFQLKYNTDLFDRETAIRMAEHFRTILDSILANPDQKVSELQILTEQERQHLLFEWNGVTTELSQAADEACVHQLFEKQVEQTPDASALFMEKPDETGAWQLTYRELNARANQLARHLRSLGVDKEVKVGICLERSVEMIVALLAVLKAGGAYVAVDTTYPDERLSYIIEDAQIRILLTQKHLTSRFSKSNLEVLALDADWENFSSQDIENLSLPAAPDDLAYIIYTSGSTGEPKGVMVEHSSLTAYTKTAGVEFKLGPEDRVLQFASISFDTSAEEIYPCLIHGATLVLRTDTMLDSASSFLSKCHEWQLTILDLPTAYWHELVVSIKDDALSFPPSIRIVIIGGEKALPERVKTWQRSVGDHVRLINTYGPTEGTIVTTMCDLAGTQKVDITSRELPIGRAIKNVQVYVLDKNLQPVPIGVPGELHVAGAGLARGYLNRPELTEEKFISNPFSEALGDKLYKTGDLVRYLPDGNLEFVGRIDHQVKIRGFRVELGEIEAALNQFGTIREAVVLCREDTPGQKRLVAYLTKEASTDLSYQEVRSFLKQRLPEYMVPASFVTLDEFPLTSAGKVDRQALPVPDRLEIELDSEFVAPRTDVEKVLADIWSRLLGVEKVGIHDNFFELGGDSILSIQIIAKANQAGIRLTTAKIFQYQTIAELAPVVTADVPTQSEQGVVTGPVKLTPYQHWFFEQDMPNPHHWNMAMLLEVRTKLEDKLVRKVLQQLVIHHDAFRLRFSQEDAEWKQQNVATDRNDSFEFLCQDISDVPEPEQESVIERIAIEQQAALNLTDGPVMRVVLFDMGESKSNRLLFIVHHMVMDGISFRVLLEDFDSAYQQLCQHEKISLPPKTTSYKEWSERLTEYAQSEAVHREIDGWKTASQAITPLPVDYPDGINTTESTQTILVSLNVDETQALLHDVPKAYNTQINDVLLTAVAISFNRWTGSSSLLFDLEGHGREDILENIDLSRTIGCFTALFPVLLELQHNTDDLGGQLKKVKEMLRQIPNRGIGYGILRYLSNDRAIADSIKGPQPEMMFNYLGQYDQVLPQGSPFLMSTGPVGPVRSPIEKRRYLIEILGRTMNGQLIMAWTFSQNVHKQASIEALASDVIETLRNIIQHCQKTGAGGFTPSDFPGAKLDQNALDSFLDKLSS